MYAKMRIESFFWKFAYSSADARGLNQFIPPTADDVAAHLGLNNFTYEDLFRPAISIPMGAYYLDFIEGLTGGGPDAMLAGYYAGPGNAGAWLDISRATRTYSWKSFGCRTRRATCRRRLSILRSIKFSTVVTEAEPRTRGLAKPAAPQSPAG